MIGCRPKVPGYRALWRQIFLRICRKSKFLKGTMFSQFCPKVSLRSCKHNSLGNSCQWLMRLQVQTLILWLVMQRTEKSWNSLTGPILNQVGKTLEIGLATLRVDSHLSRTLHRGIVLLSTWAKSTSSTLSASKATPTRLTSQEPAVKKPIEQTRPKNLTIKVL